MDGAIDLVRQLKASSFSVGIVSNGAKNSRESIVRALNIGKYVDVLVSSGEVGIKKPDVSIFNIALDHLGVRSENAWFIGDHPAIDVMGSKNAGLKPVWLAGFHEWDAEIDSPGVTVKSLREFHDFLFRPDQ